MSSLLEIEGNAFLYIEQVKNQMPVLEAFPQNSLEKTAGLLVTIEAQTGSSTDFDVGIFQYTYAGSHMSKQLNRSQNKIKSGPPT
mgnify:CR=1 FL=1